MEVKFERCCGIDVHEKEGGGMFAVAKRKYGNLAQ